MTDMTLQDLTDAVQDGAGDPVESILAALDVRPTNVIAPSLAELIGTAEVRVIELRERERRLAELRQRLDGRLEIVRTYLLGRLQADNVRGVEDPVWPVRRIANPPSVSITDSGLIPNQYRVIEERIDRAGIRRTLLAGESVQGAELVASERLEIGR